MIWLKGKNGPSNTVKEARGAKELIMKHYDVWCSEKLGEWIWSMNRSDITIEELGWLNRDEVHYNVSIDGDPLTVLKQLEDIAFNESRVGDEYHKRMMSKVYLGLRAIEEDF